MSGLENFIVEYISGGKWSPYNTDDENLNRIISEYGSLGNHDVMMFLVKDIIERKIMDGQFEAYLVEE